MDNKHTYRFSAPPDRVGEVLADIEFHLEMDRGRDDIASTEMIGHKQDGGSAEFTMVSQEYKHTMTGKIDRSGTQEGRTLFRYDGGAQILTWDYTSPQDPKRVTIKGRYLVQADGAASRLVHEYTIAIKVPLVGKKIAKMINKGFVDSFPRFESTFRRYLER